MDAARSEAGASEFRYARLERHALDALDEQWPALPSMVVSAYGEPENIIRAEESGAAGIVVKPVYFTDLRGKVAESMGDSASKGRPLKVHNLGVITGRRLGGRGGGLVRRVE